MSLRSKRTLIEGAPSRTPAILWPFVVTALLIHLLTNGRYGYFRDELYFFFSGPVLRPELTPGGIVLAIFVTLIVSVIAVIFPLVLATRIQPIVAMQASES